MTNKFSLFLSVVLLVGFVACSKSNTSAPIDTNPNITISGTSTDLLGYSSAFYKDSLTNDSLVIINGSTADSSVINNYLNLSNISSTTNYLILSINSTVARNTTYTASAIVGANFQLNGNKYQSVYTYPTSITIDTIGSVFVSGSYSSQVVNLTNSQDNNPPHTLTGKFKAYFKH